MREDRLLELAQQAGFEHTGILNTDALVLRPEVRDMCASGTCRRYGHCWTCPPGCGSLEYLQKKISKFTGGILVQTTEKLKNDFDVKTMLAAEKKHKDRFAGYDLTPRQKEVARLLLRAKTRRQISGELCVSESTIKTHTSDLYHKLGINSRVELFRRFGVDEDNHPEEG